MRFEYEIFNLIFPTAFVTARRARPLPAALDARARGARSVPARVRRGDARGLRRDAPEHTLPRAARPAAALLGRRRACSSSPRGRARRSRASTPARRRRASQEIHGAARRRGARRVARAALRIPHARRQVGRLLRTEARGRLDKGAERPSPAVMSTVPVAAFYAGGRNVAVSGEEDFDALLARARGEGAALRRRQRARLQAHGPRCARCSTHAASTRACDSRRSSPKCPPARARLEVEGAGR